MANGYGEYTHINGSRYKGEFRDDIQEGHGEEEWIDGAKYVGQYVNGMKRLIKLNIGQSPLYPMTIQRRRRKKKATSDYSPVTSAPPINSERISVYYIYIT